MHTSSEFAMKAEFKQSIVENCPICNSNSNLSYIRKYDDRFGQPDVFVYAYCEKCNVVFLKNKIMEDDLAMLYKKYYPKNGEVNKKSDKLRLILKFLKLDNIIFQWLAGNIILLKKIKNNSKVLEIGSGYSSELKKIILNKNLDWTGLEVDEDLIRQIENDNLRSLYGTVATVENGLNGKFDHVILSQSLEHQYDINAFFESSKKFLKHNGTIIFTTPNVDSRYRKKYGERWINWHAPYHITLLSKKAIENLCGKHGLKIKKYFTYTPTSWFMLQSIFEIPKRGEKNNKFGFNFSLLKQLIFSIWLRIFETTNRKSGDCIYCEVSLNS